MFCPKCKSILNLVQKGREAIFVCTCGFKTKELPEAITEKVKTGRDIGVIEDTDTEKLPTTEAKCPKCGHTSAYYWTRQTRAGDEAETRFFRCVRCKHTWRDYF